MEIDEIGHEVAIPRRTFFDEWVKRHKPERNEDLLRYILIVSNINNVENVNTSSLKDTVARYSGKINERWEKCHRKKDVFLQKFASWLDKDDFKFTIFVMAAKPYSSHGSGRPKKIFSNCCEKSKKRKVSNLLNFNSEELVFAAHLSLHAAGNRVASKLVKEAINIQNPSPSTSGNNYSIAVRCYSPEEALALFVDCRLTKASYSLLREKAREAGHELYPPYYNLQSAKKKCCLTEDEFFVDETRAELPLQALLDLTVQRLCEAQYPVMKQLVEAGVHDLTLFSKWGCDGSGGHSKYKMKFTEDKKSDEYLFMFSFVPIHLCVTNTQTYAWKNSVPGSTRYCRPIKLIFEKETTSSITVETDQVKSNVLTLTPTTIDIDGVDISVTHKLVLTMVDGKVCNALTNTQSSQTCYICHATPKQMKTGSPLLLPDITENYGFGLSTLHAWIRTLEFLLNLSYRLEIQKKQIRSDVDKNIKLLKKSKVQEEFKAQLGLNVDMPKQGSGNTNDGNTARRFFKNSALSASITGLDESLIKRFRVILQTLSSGYEIDVDKFEKYTSETKKLLVQLYPWYDMSPTIHKILEHSAQVVRHHLVPIGQLSEESQEARNKDCRRFRLHNTRKHSRISTNKDLLTMLLVTSDPVIVSFRKHAAKKSNSLDPESLELLTCSIPVPNSENMAASRKVDASEDESSDSDF